MNRSKFWIGLFIITFSLALVALPLLAQEGESILKLSLNAQSRIDFEGIREVRIYTLDRVYNFRIRVIYQKPDFLYLEYLDPPEVKGKIIIDDGKRRIEYRPRVNKIKVFSSLNSPQSKRIRENILKIMLNNFKISQISQGRILERPVYILFLSPRNFSGPSLKLWIDKETYLTLRREKYTSQGKLLFSLQYTEVEFNKHLSRERCYANLPRIPSAGERSSLLSCSPLQEIISQIEFPLFLPRYLPPGYIFQGGELVGKRKKAVKLIYTNGLEVIVLFQSPRVDIMMGHHRFINSGNLKIRLREGPHGRTLVWNRMGRTFILMGETTLKELIKVASSIE